MTEHGSNPDGVDSSHTATVLNLGEDPGAVIAASVWAQAAVLGTMRDAVSAPIESVLAAHPERTAVLERVGLVRRGPEGLSPHPSLRSQDGAVAAARIEARLSSLRQAVAVAAGEEPAGWADHDDEVLLHQGRASAGTGRALAERLVPALPGLTEKLSVSGAQVLDVGTGTAALAIALARSLPHVAVVGIDVAERPLVLARREIDAADDVSSRVVVRRQDVVDVAERDVFGLVWLPAPFLSQEVLTAALPRLVASLDEGGWIVVGTNPVSADPLTAAVDRWNAVRGGGSVYDAASAVADLAAAGLVEVGSYPTVPGGPVLVAARRAPRGAGEVVG